MKKLVFLLFLILLFSFNLIGCSSDSIAEEGQAGKDSVEVKADADEEPLIEAEKANQQDNPNAGGVDSQGKAQIRDMYDFNKEYEYDLDGDQVVDVFVFDTDSMEYCDLIINDKRYPLNALNQEPELVYFKYKLTKFNDDNKYAITIFAACPPSDEEVYFYEYDIASGLRQIGVVTSPTNDLFDKQIISLSYEQVDFGDKSFSFRK